MINSHLQEAGLSPGAVREAALLGDPVALTQLLVATPSVNPELESDGSGEEDAARLAAGWLESWGLDTAVSEVAPGRWNVLARLGSGSPRLLLNGHLDTVGVEGMTIPSFLPETREGRIYGRGACDMKGGVASLLSAVAHLARSWEDGALDGEVIVALTADEEYASVGMQSLVDSGLQADFAVVCEPTSLAVMPAHKGFLWLDFLTHGKAAHGSRPDQGVDAIMHMGRVLKGLEDMDRGFGSLNPHPLLGRPSLHAGIIQGGSALSVYPAQCKLQVERRTLPGKEMDGVVGEFQAFLRQLLEGNPELDVSMHPGLFRPGTEVDLEHEGITALLACCGDVGLEPSVEGMSAWADAALLNQAGTPSICFGPGSLARAHGAVEWVEVEELEACAKILERLARRLLA
ncbi:MAG: M20/M25/M40 family metallo-hydrolase [Gemmatimonadota bacterium]